MSISGIFDSIVSIVSGGVVPVIAVLIIILAFAAFGQSLTRLWIKVPPNTAAVFFGRKSKDAEGNDIGFRIMTGGGRFRIPWVEEVQFFDLSLINLEINVANVANKDGVQINLKGNANVFFKNDPPSLQNVIRKFLNKPRSEVEGIIHKSLEGHLRGIAGQMTIEEIISDRVKFGQKVKSEAGDDLAKFGLEVDFVTISEITDNENYIKVLGQKRTAEVQKDAALGKAQADRDTDIGKAEAQKEATIKSTTAQQEAATRKAENEAKIAEAEKERNVKQATYEAETARQKAIAEQAGPLATAEKKKEVVAAEQEVIRIQTLKQAEIAVAKAEQVEKDLIATQIKPAEAEQKKKVIDAEAAQKTTIINAEADQKRIIIKAEADREATIKNAEASKRKLELEAEGEAAKILAIGKAKAQAIQMEKEAEAAGVSALAKSYKEMDEVGRTIQMIEKVGEVGPKLIEEFSKVVGAAAAPLANVDKITITDFGGNGNAVSGLTKVAPQIVAQTVEAFRGVGIDPTELLRKFKLNPESVVADPKVKDVLAKTGLTPEMVAELAKSFTGVTPEMLEAVTSKEPRIINPTAGVKSEILDKVPDNLKK